MCIRVSVYTYLGGAVDHDHRVEYVVAGGGAGGEEGVVERAGGRRVAALGARLHDRRVARGLWAVYVYMCICARLRDRRVARSLWGVYVYMCICVYVYMRTPA